MTIYNFSAGPALLPQDVLREAQRELTDLKHGSGMSVMEMIIADASSCPSTPRQKLTCANPCRFPTTTSGLALQARTASFPAGADEPVAWQKHRRLRHHRATGARSPSRKRRSHGDMHCRNGRGQAARTYPAAVRVATQPRSPPGLASLPTNHRRRSFRSFELAYRWSVTCRATSRRDQTAPASGLIFAGAQKNIVRPA